MGNILQIYKGSIKLVEMRVFRGFFRQNGL